MSKKKIRTIAYLGADAFTKGDEIKKGKQLKYINEYAKAHNLCIVKIINISYLGKAMRKKQIKQITDDIFNRKAEAMIVTKTQIIADNIAEAYAIAGEIASVGGILITVAEGILSLNVRMMPIKAKIKRMDGD